MTTKVPFTMVRAGATSDWPKCRLTKTAVQSIPNAAFTAVTWDVETYDPTGMHSLVSNTSRITCAVAGQYMFTAYTQWASNGAGLRYAMIMRNGGATAADRVATNFCVAADDAVGRSVIVAVVDLAVGDYVELQLFQSSGGNLDLTASSASDGVTYLACHMLP